MEGEGPRCSLRAIKGLARRVLHGVPEGAVEGKGSAPCLLSHLGFSRLLAGGSRLHSFIVYFRKDLSRS